MRWIVIAILLLPTVYSLGISQTYYPNATISLQQGTNTTHAVIVQNSLAEPLQIVFSIDGEYVTIQGHPLTKNITLTLPSRTYDNTIILDISIPSDAKPGQHTVTYSVQPVVPEEGMVQMNIRLNDHFIIAIEQNPAFAKPPILRWAAIALATILILLGIGLSTQKIIQYNKTKPKRPPRGAYIFSTHFATTPSQMKTILQYMSEEEYARHKHDIALWLYEKTKNKTLHSAAIEAKNKKELEKYL